MLEIWRVATTINTFGYLLQTRFFTATGLYQCICLDIEQSFIYQLFAVIRVCRLDECFCWQVKPKALIREVSIYFINTSRYPN